MLLTTQCFVYKLEAKMKRQMESQLDRRRVVTVPARSSTLEILRQMMHDVNLAVAVGRTLTILRGRNKALFQILYLV